MKKILLIALCAFLAHGAFCAFPQNDFKQQMAIADSLGERNEVTKAMAIYNKLASRVRAANEPVDYLWVLLSKYKLEYEKGIRPKDAVLTSLDSLKRTLKIPLRNVVAMAQSEFYLRELNDPEPYVRRYIHRYDSIPLEKWSFQNYFEKLLLLNTEAMGDGYLNKLDHRDLGFYMTKNPIPCCNFSAMEAIGNRLYALYNLHVNQDGYEFITDSLKATVVNLYQKHGLKESLLLLKMDILHKKEELESLLNEAKGSKADYLIKRAYAISLINSRDFDEALKMIQSDKRYATDTMVQKMMNVINLDEIKQNQSSYKTHINPYPNKEWMLTLTCRNSAFLNFSLYRLPDNVEGSHLFSDKIAALSTFLKSWTEKVPESKSKNGHAVALMMPPLSSGNYTVKINTQNDSLWVSFRVSPFAVMSCGNLLTIVDRNNGLPVEGVKVDFKEERKSYRSDSMGCVTLPAGETYREGTVTMDGRTIPLNLYPYGMPPQRDFSYILFTDRPAYEKGDTIKYKIICYQQESVVAGREFEVSFSYNQSPPFFIHKVKTDEYGSISGEYVIPGDYPNNNIDLFLGKERLRSIDFVRETLPRAEFDLFIEERSVWIDKGDSIRIKGRVFAANGFGIEGADIRCSFMNRVVGREIKSGDNGHFYYVIPYHEEFTKSGIEILAISPTGNKVRNTIGVSVRDQRKDYLSLHSFNTLGELVDKTNFPRVSMNDKDHQPIKAPFHIKLFETDIPYQNYFSGRVVSDFSEYTLLTPESLFKEKFPEFTIKKPEPKMRVLLDSDFEDGTVATEAVAKALSKPGNYLFKCSRKGEKEWEGVPYTLISKNSKESIPSKVLYAYTDTEKYTAGENVEIILGCDMDSLSVLVFKTIGKETKLVKIEMVSHEQKKIAVPFDVNDKGFAKIEFVAMRNNLPYHAEINFDQDSKQRELTVEIESFRDRVEVGSNEKWRVKVKDYTGEGTKSQLIAYLYNNATREPSMSFLIHYNEGLIRNYNLSRTLNNGVQFVSYYQECNPFSGIIRDNFNPLTLYTPLSSTYDNRVKRSLYEIFGSTRWLKSEQFNSIEKRRVYSPASSGIIANSENLLPHYDETKVVFFLPVIETDDKGIATIDFTAPKNEGRWTGGITAHTKDSKSGRMDVHISTFKQLVITINQPRFVREGCKTEITARIENRSDKEIKCVSEMTIDDLKFKSKKLTIGAHSSVTVGWDVLPKSSNEFIDCTVTVTDGVRRDGEKIRILSVPTQPIQKQTFSEAIEKGQQKQFNLQVPKKPVPNSQVKLEVVSNPLWLVMEMLPKVASASGKSAMDLFNNHFARHMAVSIRKSMPGALDSFLKEKQEDSTLVAFYNRANGEMRDAFKKLTVGNLFPWFDQGVEPDLYTSIKIAVGVRKFVKEEPFQMRRLNWVLNDKMQPLSDELSHMEVYYLYMMAYQKKSYNNAMETTKLYHGWPKRPILLQMMTGIALYQRGDKKGAGEIAGSVLEKEYYDHKGWVGGITEPDKKWYNRPVETRALMIELLTLVDEDLYKIQIDRLKKWLVKNRHSDGWGDSSSTIEACYALMLNAEKTMFNKVGGTIDLNGKKDSFDRNYVEYTFEEKEVASKLNKVSVTNLLSDFCIASVFYQHPAESMNEQNSSSWLSVQRKVITEKNVKVGDKVTVRLLIVAKEDVDFVRLCDHHAASLDPILGSERFDLSWPLTYRMVRGKSSADFYFRQLPKGTYTIEYSAIMASKGDLISGFTEIESPAITL